MCRVHLPDGTCLLRHISSHSLPVPHVLSKPSSCSPVSSSHPSFHRWPKSLLHAVNRTPQTEPQLIPLSSSPVYAACLRRRDFLVLCLPESLLSFARVPESVVSVPACATWLLSHTSSWNDLTPSKALWPRLAWSSWCLNVVFFFQATSSVSAACVPVVTFLCLKRFVPFHERRVGIQKYWTSSFNIFSEFSACIFNGQYCLNLKFLIAKNKFVISFALLLLPSWCSSEVTLILLRCPDHMPQGCKVILDSSFSHSRLVFWFWGISPTPSFLFWLLLPMTLTSFHS